MIAYTGNPVSPGLAQGPVYRYQPQEITVIQEQLPAGQAEEAVRRYQQIKAQAVWEVSAIHDRLAISDPQQAKIFEAHLEILEDDTMNEAVEDAVAGDRCALPWAIDRVYRRYIKRFESLPDPLIRERAADLDDIRKRLLRLESGAARQDLSHLPHPVLVVARDLLPSDTATLDRAHVLGIITEEGGPTSHTAILARSYALPALLGVKDALRLLPEGESVLLDALEGKVICAPDRETLDRFQVRRQAFARQQELTRQYLHQPGRTADGVRVDFGLNMGALKPEDRLPAGVVDYVGLLRTEFLYMDSRHMPTEEEQYQQYRLTLEAFSPRPVTLRTLDIGGDKTLPYFPLPREENPALGMRALRLCLAHPEVFQTQLRAALRASVYGTLWIMFPMVGSLDDIRQAKAMVEKVKRQLSEEGIPFRPDVKLGVMIEIPALALMADQVAREVDFASIGTNDLCQYLTAADRQNSAAASYYQSYHPALFRLLHGVIQAFARAGKPLSVCGELSGTPLAAGALVGLGLRKISMNPSSVAPVKQLLAGQTLAHLEQAAAEILSFSTARQVEDHLRQSFLPAGSSGR